MGWFFLFIFGFVYLVVVFVKDSAATSKSRTVMQENTTRYQRWTRKVHKGPLNNVQFNEKLRLDTEFRNQLIKETNDILASIPELKGNRLGSWQFHKEKAIYWKRTLEMVYCAKTGDLPVCWMDGWIESYVFGEALSKFPDKEGITAFFKWYERELQKNGFYDAKILPVIKGGFPYGWYFPEAIDYAEVSRYFPYSY